jgi:hypothetical protein
MIWVLQCDTINGCGKPYGGDELRCPHCDTDSIFSSPYPVNPRDYGWDIETYPNATTYRFIHIATDTRWKFEISTRMNQIGDLIEFIRALQSVNARLVGYNNVSFDWPVCQRIVENPWWGVNEIYHQSQKHFNGTKDEKHKLKIWPDQRFVEQLDLFLIHHFDNANRRTRLKDLEFAMRMKNIEDLPFPPGTILTDPQIDELHTYNEHDVVATVLFYARTIAQIEFRETLSAKYDRDFMNHNDTKIGKDFMVMELEKAGIPCYEKVAGKRQPRQTFRPTINLGDVIFDYIKFERPEFNSIMQQFRNTTIPGAKGDFKKLTAIVDGLEYDFGKGGLHMSVESKIFHTNNTHQIVDVDVASFYPNLAIKNKLFPAHLSDLFCDIFLDVYNLRKSFPKGSPENAMLKLALNGVYGDSSSPFSPYYDPFFTMLITINGQLLLTMLVEQLIKIPGLSMIQANTDGVTFHCPHEYMGHQRDICKWWEGFTLLTLEEALYSRMFIKNVNGYIAEYEPGKLKSIKSYKSTGLGWHQDFSSLVVPKAVEAALVRGESIRDFVMNHTDPFDFMIRKKTRKSDDLVMRWPGADGIEDIMPGVFRYFVSNEGGTITTLSPPTGEAGTWKRANKLTNEYFNLIMGDLENMALNIYAADNMGFLNHEVDKKGNHVIVNTATGELHTLDDSGIPHDERIFTKNKSKHQERKETGVVVGWLVTDCMDADRFNWSELNREYYIAEAEKLVNPLY